MVNVEYRDSFLRTLSKIKDKTVKQKIKKQMIKILKDPDIGKPMKYARKETRELYIKPYRLAYSYFKNKIIFLDIYHKNKQSP